MNIIKTISGFDEIIDLYEIIILDQWGVMHDGRRGYLNAIECVEKLNKLNKKLIIISNSSKRKKTTSDRLSLLGYNKDFFSEIMTSGEMIWQSLKKTKHDFTKKLKKNCLHIFDNSKEDGKSFLLGLDKYNFVEDIDEADFILGCTPYSNFKPLDYLPTLNSALKRKLPFCL